METEGFKVLATATGKKPFSKESMAAIAKALQENKQKKMQLLLQERQAKRKTKRKAMQVWRSM